MRPHIVHALKAASKALDALMQNQETLTDIEKAAKLLTDAFRGSGRVYSCGNGGSMCDAIHFAEELTGRFRDNRTALAASAISDPGHISCVANDFGYDHVFSKYIEANGHPGDVIVGISTSGSSENIIRAARTARERQMKVITLTGNPGSALGQLADIDICAPGGAYADRIQELHIKIIHILIEMVEREMFPENYRA